MMNLAALSMVNFSCILHAATRAMTLSASNEKLMLLLKLGCFEIVSRLIFRMNKYKMMPCKLHLKLSNIHRGLMRHLVTNLFTKNGSYPKNY